jgi:hypothetical protein
MLHEITPLNSPLMHARLLKLGNPHKTLQRMHALIKNICSELNERLALSNACDSVDSVTNLVESVTVKDDIKEEDEDEDGAETQKEAKDDTKKVS